MASTPLIRLLAKVDRDAEAAKALVACDGEYLRAQGLSESEIHAVDTGDLADLEHVGVWPLLALRMWIMRDPSRVATWSAAEYFAELRAQVAGAEVAASATGPASVSGGR